MCLNKNNVVVVVAVVAVVVHLRYHGMIKTTLFFSCSLTWVFAFILTLFSINSLIAIKMKYVT